MLVDLGCNVMVQGFEIKNTHNGIMDNFATKAFRISLEDWTDENIHRDLLTGELPDSRGKVGFATTKIKHQS